MFKKYKKLIIVAVVVFLVIGISSFCIYKILTKKKDANTIINEMVAMYYEQYYDDLVLNNPKTYQEKLEKASKNSIKKTLFDISRSVDHEEEYRILNSQESGINCNVFNTIATYYPKSPYGREDYKVDLTIDCSE